MQKLISLLNTDACGWSKKYCRSQASTVWLHNEIFFNYCNRIQIGHGPLYKEEYLEELSFSYILAENNVKEMNKWME